MMRYSDLAHCVCFSACLLVIVASSSSIAQTSSAAEILLAPKEGGPRRWEVVDDNTQAYSTPSVESDIISTFIKGDVLSNLGCSETNGQNWCEIRPFRGGLSGFVTGLSLQPARGPDGVIPVGVNDTEHRARKRDFDKKGKISCAQERGQAMSECGVAIARSEGGDATVVVTFPNGFARHLYFVHGEFVRASATMSGVGTDTDWRLENEQHYLHVDDQRYELSDALIFKE